MSVIRDILRRRGRSILTISGTALGVLALVVLGAVAENMNVYSQRLVGYYGDVITVVEQDAGNSVSLASGVRPLSTDIVGRLQAQPGVEDARAQVTVLFDDEYFAMVPPTVVGSDDVARSETAYEGYPLAEGRPIREGEHRVVILGPDLARQLEARVGETIDVRGEEFEVVGLLDRTYINLVDSIAYVSLADAQRMYFDSLPEAYQKNVQAKELLTQVVVTPKPGTDAEALAGELGEVEGIRAIGPTEMMKSTASLATVMNVVVVSVASLAVIICVLSITNTMTMAVTERVREIGMKRALGASRPRIAREIIAESAVMGGIAGLVGLVFGSAIALALNSAFVTATGTTALLVTARLAANAVGFAVMLGMLGGLFPARYASLLDPATALVRE